MQEEQLLIPKNALFICYRRDDSKWAAGRLVDALRARMGHDAVFLDVSGLQPGENWRAKISPIIRHAQAVLVVMGEKWVEIGKTRLLDAADPIRQELGHAFGAAMVKVIPVLIDNANSPTAADFAEINHRDSGLAGLINTLSDLHAVRLRYEYFDADCEGLVRQLRDESALSHVAYVALHDGLKVPKAIRWKADGKVMVLVHRDTSNAKHLPQYCKTPPFYIDKYEVSESHFTKALPELATSRGIKGAGTDLPMTGISLEDARRYANKVHKSLPTHDQWQAAAAGQDPSAIYPTTKYDPQAFNTLDTRDPDFALESVYARRPQNKWGVVSMIGNGPELALRDGKDGEVVWCGVAVQYIGRAKSPPLHERLVSSRGDREASLVGFRCVVAVDQFDPSAAAYEPATARCVDL